MASCLLTDPNCQNFHLVKTMLAKISMCYISLNLLLKLGNWDVKSRRGAINNSRANKLNIYPGKSAGTVSHETIFFG
jgi:hypothetical protein